VNALLDTTVWSLAVQRKKEDLNPTERMASAELAELLREGRGKIIGLIRQELLSDIRDRAPYERLRVSLQAFRDEPINTADHESAAKRTTGAI
jgi:hypothetical protein